MAVRDQPQFAAAREALSDQAHFRTRGGVAGSGAATLIISIEH